MEAVIGKKFYYFESFKAEVLSLRQGMAMYDKIFWQSLSRSPVNLSQKIYKIVEPCHDLLWVNYCKLDCTIPAILFTFSPSSINPNSYLQIKYERISIAYCIFSLKYFL